MDLYLQCSITNCNSITSTSNHGPEIHDVKFNDTTSITWEGDLDQ